MAVSRKGVSQKKMPPGNAVATKRMSAGRIVTPQDNEALRNFRNDSAKLKDQPTPAPIPPQPFAPQTGKRVPV